MAQVYEEAMEQSDNDTLKTARAKVNSQTLAGLDIYSSNQNNLSAYTRTSENEINNLFPQLPNPQLVMYVYPHLAGNDEAPIPGYSTAFSLYKKKHYSI